MVAVSDPAQLTRLPVRSPEPRQPGRRRGHRAAVGRGDLQAAVGVGRRGPADRRRRGRGAVPRCRRTTTERRGPRPEADRGERVHPCDAALVPARGGRAPWVSDWRCCSASRSCPATGRGQGGPGRAAAEPLLADRTQGGEGGTHRWRPGSSAVARSAVDLAGKVVQRSGPGQRSRDEVGGGRGPAAAGGVAAAAHRGPDPARSRAAAAHGLLGSPPACSGLVIGVAGAARVTCPPRSRRAGRRSRTSSPTRCSCWRAACPPATRCRRRPNRGASGARRR